MTLYYSSFYNNYISLMPTINLTKYIPSKGVFFGGVQVMTPDTVSRWSRQFNAPAKTLGGLRLFNPQQIIRGGSIGYRDENQSYATVGRSTIFGGNGLIQSESTSFQAAVPTLTQSSSSSFMARPQPQVQTRSTPNISVISTPHIASSRPLIRSPYSQTDPYGMANYLDLRYEDLSREIERARFQRKLERLEDEYAKERKKKTPRKRKTSQKKRKTPKRKTTSRKKSKGKKRK
jgi:hypothetical protein